MENCKKCNSEISKGKVCMSCVNEATVDLVKHIEKMNWNLGAISQSLKKIADKN